VTPTNTIQSFRIEVCGVVQGVGFRPFVYRLARKNGLIGWVRNTSGSVEIELKGEEEALNLFLRQLETEAPPICRIEDIKISRQIPVAGYHSFEIRASQAQEGKYQLISPDIATCRQCLEEIANPGDRRYRYPFTNCTNCGPRFTIIEDIPYDRPNTTMSRFQMCPQCQQEYDEPADRRFHAQPNACPVCGPHLELVDRSGKTVAERDDALTQAAKILCAGNILAIKGLGGFLLACDATSDKAVSLLRQRKKRAAKPLAIMFASLEEAEKHCHISPGEAELLSAPQSPIVLVRWRDDSNLSPLIAPGLKYQGIMLPYTPLHHLILRDTGLPLVMTSGNLSEEPIARDNDEALRRLGSIADYFLMHNRDIYSRYDDSVAVVEDKPRLVRRARGYAPSPINLPFKSRQILACGAELKNTFCLSRDEYAFLSQHIADLENMESLEHYRNTIELYKKLFNIEPQIIAHDLHPDYLSTGYAREVAQASPGIAVFPVQHHHAHIVSCMVENGVKDTVIGVAFDGTGYGSDGCIWGGEFLLVDYSEFERLGHLEYMPLPGAEAAIKKPYRTAAGYAYRLLGNEALEDLPFIQGIDKLELDLIKKQVDQGINAPLTSSCGRLFDAVSALIGLRGEIEYEAQAAIELEMAAMDAKKIKGSGYPYSVTESDGVDIIGFGDSLSAIISDLKKGAAKPKIAYRFHQTVSSMVADTCCRIAKRTGIPRVALSGGVFQNRLLLRLTLDALDKAGLDVITHGRVPTNDGCISLGQAAIANSIAEG